MSYCVNCGVELDATASFCPLCHTPVYNPNQPVDETSPKPFPTERKEVPPVSRIQVAILLTAIFASVGVCCGVLNIFLRTQHTWSLYVIGAVIMAHGDNNGLVLPPKIAPTQVIVLPVAMHKAGVLDAAAKVKERLIAAGLRVKMDDSDNSMGWKCAQYEMKGVPLRLELGPRDIEAGQCVLVRRNDGEKTVVSLENLEAAVAEQLELVQKGMFEKAKQNLDNHVFEAHSLEEAKKLQAENGGFIKTMWCGELECELKMKEEGGMSSRCMPLKQEHLDDVCPICGKPAKKMIYWGVAY